MRTITYCGKCGSTDVLIDAYQHANTGDVSTYDNCVCAKCEYDGNDFREVELTQAQIDEADLDLGDGFIDPETQLPKQHD